MVVLRIAAIHLRSEEPHIMNTLPKSFTIAILAVSIFISELTVDFAGAQDTAAGTAAAGPCRGIDRIVQHLLLWVKQLNRTINF
jgi:hypothetical protein